MATRNTKTATAETVEDIGARPDDAAFAAEMAAQRDALAGMFPKIEISARTIARWCLGTIAGCAGWYATMSIAEIVLASAALLPLGGFICFVVAVLAIVVGFFASLYGYKLCVSLFDKVVPVGTTTSDVKGKIAGWWASRSEAKPARA